MRSMIDHTHKAQQAAAAMGYVLPTDPRATNAAIFDRLSNAAAKSNRKDAKQLSDHYAKRASSLR